MKNLRDYNDYVNEDLGMIFIGAFFTVFAVMALWVLKIFAMYPIASIRVFINKLKTNRQFRRELLEILQTLTKEQKSELKKYVKNSVFAHWEIITTSFAGGSETSYDRDTKVDEEKEKLLSIFDGEQREKLEKLLIKMEDEIRHQVMRDSDEWGIKDPDPDLSLSWKPKLDLRSLKDKSREEEWQEHKTKYNAEQSIKNAEKDELERSKKDHRRKVMTDQHYTGSDTQTWDNYKYKNNNEYVNEEWNPFKSNPTSKGSEAGNAFVNNLIQEITENPKAYKYDDRGDVIIILNYNGTEQSLNVYSDEIYISPTKHLAGVGSMPKDRYDYSKVKGGNLVVDCDPKLVKKLNGMLKDITDPKIDGNIRKSQQLKLHGKPVKVGDRIINFEDWVSHPRENEIGRGVIKKIKTTRWGEIKRFVVLFDPKDGKPAQVNPYVYPEHTELEEGYVPWDVKERERKEQRKEKNRYKQTSNTQTWDSYKYKG